MTPVPVTSTPATTMKMTPVPVVTPVKMTPVPVVLPVKMTPVPVVLPVKMTPVPVVLPVKVTYGKGGRVGLYDLIFDFKSI